MAGVDVVVGLDVAVGQGVAVGRGIAVAVVVVAWLWHHRHCNLGFAFGRHSSYASLLGCMYIHGTYVPASANVSAARSGRARKTSSAPKSTRPSQTRKRIAISVKRARQPSSQRKLRPKMPQLREKCHQAAVMKKRAQSPK